MKPSKHVRFILSSLNNLYPEVRTQLAYRSPFELLVATILSAQCTDKQVNAVTPNLFSVLSTPKDFAESPLELIEDLIKPTGYYRNKAKHIKNCALMLLEQFQGEVPNKLDDLVQLPGVGRKTANCVLGAVFGIPGIVVDTHVARISKRLGLTEETQPEKIEKDLMAQIPKKDWNDFSLRLIYFGRAVCTARKPDCPGCPFNSICRHAMSVNR